MQSVAKTGRRGNCCHVRRLLRAAIRVPRPPFRDAPRPSSPALPRPAGIYAAARSLAPIPAAAQAAYADLIIENAKIITLDPAMPSADALAVTGDRIMRVGTRADLQPLVGPNTRTVDAGGRTMVPG